MECWECMCVHMCVVDRWSDGNVCMCTCAWWIDGVMRMCYVHTHVHTHIPVVGRWSDGGACVCTCVWWVDGVAGRHGRLLSCFPVQGRAYLDLHIIPRAVKARGILDLIFWKHTSRQGHSNSHH